MIYLWHAFMAKCTGGRVPRSAIRPPFFSGCIWAMGFALMVAGIGELGYAVGYVLDAVGPVVVSSLLSMLVFREISGTSQILTYCAGFTLQLCGVILIAIYGKASP
mmetsp:Transcript_38829/g.102608  ORF Transcript_38829/g.102608 Transcript_38829/m.102608 type:complete len:106 (-) Transcript_38829:64-381(-)